MCESDTSEREAVHTIPIWERAERAYNRVLTTVWIGNAGAILATLAYITANRHDGTFNQVTAGSAGSFYPWTGDSRREFAGGVRV